MIIVIRRLQYSDERDDYNQMDTSRLIEEEAQYNAWSSWSLSWPFWPPASWPAWPPSLPLSWPSWPPWSGWSRYVCVARGKKAVCKTRRHLSLLFRLMLKKLQFVIFAKFCKFDAKFGNQLNQSVHQNAWLQCHSSSKSLAFRSEWCRAVHCSSVRLHTNCLLSMRNAKMTLE